MRQPASVGRTGQDFESAIYEPELGELPENGLEDIDDDKVNKTGTTTVGLTTAEGVVLAADKRASLGGRFVSNKDVQKIEQIHPTAAITMAGSVGGAQLYIRNLRAETNLYEARRGEQMSMEALSTFAGNLLLGLPALVNPVLGGVDETGPHVYAVDPAGGVMEDTYTVTGSGLTVAYGTLEREYEEGLSNEEARTVAASAVKAAVERDTASGNGVFIATITDEAVETEDHKDFDEVL